MNDGVHMGCFLRVEVLRSLVPGIPGMLWRVLLRSSLLFYFSGHSVLIGGLYINMCATCIYIHTYLYTYIYIYVWQMFSFKIFRESRDQGGFSASMWPSPTLKHHVTCIFESRLHKASSTDSTSPFQSLAPWGRFYTYM